MRPRFALILLLAVVFPALIRAQTVRWNPDRGPIPVGQTRELNLLFEDCAPRGEPALPRVPDLTMRRTGQTTSTSIVNGAFSGSVILTYEVRLSQNHPVDIPAFTVETDKGQLRVGPARYEPTSATVGGTATPLSDAATARLTLAPSSVWAGEVFDLTANVEAASNYYPQFNKGFDWTADPLIAETWSDSPQRSDQNVGGQQRTGYTYRTRAFVRSPGRFNLNAATHIVSLSLNTTGFGFFQSRNYDQYSVTSNTPTVEVKALPTPPAGFGGAVGQFQLVSKIVPEKAAVGEPITWTLELSGTGNWPDIPGLPSRNVSADFNVVQPKAKRTPAEGKIFDVTISEDVVLVPTKAGSYVLGPVAFSYFDPKSGSYKTVSTPRTTVTVTAPAASQFQLGLQPPVVSPLPDATPAAAPKSEPPAIAPPPVNLPRDPLPGSDVAALPLTTGKVVAAALAPFAALLLLWVFLAVGLAKKTDPLRTLREARIRLADTINKLGTAATDAERAALILAWQHDVAILWELTHAAPPATALPEAAWSTLWAESDRALYGAKNALPLDWTARAATALAAKRVPSFRPLRLFLPRNLFPFAAVIVCGLCALATLRAADGGAQYRAGDFTGAEKTWRDALAARPTDWIARHNLSLALAQQARDGEASAHAAAAFVQHPDSPSYAQFVFAGEKAGFAAPEFALFLNDSQLHRLARQASPATWQRLLIAGAFGAALALAWLLVNAYGARRPLHRTLALALSAACLVLAGTAAAAWKAYGLAADSRAVIVWRPGTLRSIPTEADTTQKTSPLAAGSLAIVDKTYVNDRWQHLVFANGQTGWTRKDDVVPLWR